MLLKLSFTQGMVMEETVIFTATMAGSVLQKKQLKFIQLVSLPFLKLNVNVLCISDYHF
jgi:hypothetical protein